MNVLDVILGPVFKIIDKIIPDPAAKAQMQLDVLKLQQAGEFKELDAQLQIALAQAQTNTAEAQSADFFTRGWRPGIGWVCGLALLFQYILRPLLQWAFAVLHQPIPELPGIDENLWQLMLGMLGIGGLRTYEKVKGVAK